MTKVPSGTSVVLLYIRTYQVYDNADEAHLMSNTTHPGYVAHVAAQIASLRGIKVEEVAEVTGRNAMDLYGLRPDNRLEEEEVAAAAAAAPADDGDH